jgi:hypothetical protein
MPCRGHEREAGGTGLIAALPIRRQQWPRDADGTRLNAANAQLIRVTPTVVFLSRRAHSDVMKKILLELFVVAGLAILLWTVLSPLWR